jgi:hypothetical protein
MQTKSSRRRFIKSAGLLGIAGTVGARISIAAELLTDPLGRRLANLLKEAESASVIGKPYLDAMPEENDPNVIVSRMAVCHPIIVSKLRTAGETDAKTLLAKMVTEDFYNANIVQLNGWILSKTEARLCALTTLLERT